jgi:hypothetical protein
MSRQRERRALCVRAGEQRARECGGERRKNGEHARTANAASTSPGAPANSVVLLMPDFNLALYSAPSSSAHRHRVPAAASSPHHRPPSLPHSPASLSPARHTQSCRPWKSTLRLRPPSRRASRSRRCVLRAAGPARLRAAPAPAPCPGSGSGQCHHRTLTHSVCVDAVEQRLSVVVGHCRRQREWRLQRRAGCKLLPLRCVLTAMALPFRSFTRSLAVRHLPQPHHGPVHRVPGQPGQCHDGGVHRGVGTVQCECAWGVGG